MQNEYIKFVKAYAMLGIVIYHFAMEVALPKPFSQMIRLGGGGVHAFIFASGFGLFLSKYKGAALFYKRRFSKVLIPYFIAVTIIFLFNLKLNLFSDGFPAFLSHILLYKMFIERFTGSFGGQLWFLSTIIQFYLVYPLLLKCIKRYKANTCIAVALGISITYATITAVIGYSDVRVVNSFFLQYLWEFVLGMVIAQQSLITKITDSKWYILLTVCILSYALMGVLSLKLGAVGINLNDIFSFSGYLSLSILAYNLLNKFKLGLKLIMNIEPISYSLFLTHTFVFTFFMRYIFHDLTFLNLAIIFFVCIAVAVLFQKATNKLFTLNAPVPTKLYKVH